MPKPSVDDSGFTITLPTLSAGGGVGGQAGPPSRVQAFGTGAYNIGQSLAQLYYNATSPFGALPRLMAPGIRAANDWGNTVVNQLHTNGPWNSQWWAQSATSPAIINGTASAAAGVPASPFATSGYGLYNAAMGYGSAGTPFRPAAMPNYGSISQAPGTPYGGGAGYTPYNGYGLYNAAMGYGNRTTPFGVGGGGGGAGGGPGRVNGMTPEEAKWAGIAAKLGVNWDAVKNVYMNPHRNGTPNVADAIGRAADDKAWGDAAFKYGILNGDPNHDNQVWVDHYNSGGTFDKYGNLNPYDPMAGHGDAAANYKANQDSMQQQANPPDQYPSWYQAPAP